MIDTLHTIVNSVHQTSFDGVDLLNKVDSFYNSAWDKLLVIGSIVFVVLPIIFTLYQKSALKLQKEKILGETQKQLDKLKTELQDELKKEYKKEIKKLEEKTNIKFAANQGIFLHMIGGEHLKNNNIELAASSFFNSLICYLDGEDYKNFQIVCDNILTSCYPKITKKTLDDFFHKEGISKKEYFAYFKKYKNFKTIEHQIDKLISGANNLKD